MATRRFGAGEGFVTVMMLAKTSFDWPSNEVGDSSLSAEVFYTPLAVYLVNTLPGCHGKRAVSIAMVFRRSTCFFLSNDVTYASVDLDVDLWVCPVSRAGWAVGGSWAGVAPRLTHLA